MFTVRLMLCTSVVLGAAGFAYSETSDGVYVPERQDQPYMPGAGQIRGGPRGVALAPPGSVQVNVDGNGLNIVGDAANEPSITIDPTNPQRMAIGWRQFDTIASNFRQAGYAYTTDGGQTWTFPGVLEPAVFRSDPVLCADNTGKLFYNSLQGNFCMDVWRSTDGGATWPDLVPAFGGDKQWMDIDRTGGIGEGNLYSHWQSAAVCSGSTSNLFTRSTDHGLTWMSPISFPNNLRFGTIHVASNGDVFVTGTSNSNASNAVVVRSSNAENSAVTPTWDFSVVSPILGGAQTLSTGPNPAGLLGQIQIFTRPTDPSHVYLLCSVNPTGSDPLDVRFARSVDGGQTWSPSIKVNDDTSTTAYQWFGTMSVAPNGRIDVVWNDTKDDPSNLLSRTYYSFSVNEGVTWSASRALTPQWNSQLGFPMQNKIGDYYHMISYNDAAHLAYAATFNGEQDVYYTRITPLPACATCAADLTGDSSTDGADIAAFMSCVLRFPVTASSCGCADMNGDQIIDLNDIAPFVDRLLLGGCP